MQIPMVATKEGCYYLEKPSSMSDADFNAWKRTEQRFIKMASLTLEEDVKASIENSAWKQFLPLIEPKFRCVVKGAMYSVDWYEFCTNTLGYLEREKADRFQQIYNCEMTNINKRADGGVNSIETVVNGEKKTIECDRLILC